ncbi:MAG TPA: hypothetical protein VGR35_09525 [Tepidisphaeraceae bacterium]|nr:hypothetical protein [Tepidisphaeraceae bacterium]
MLIKLKTCLVGNGWSHNAGDIGEIEDKYAIRLIEAGFAEPVKQPTVTRTATAPQQPVETTSEAK